MTQVLMVIWRSAGKQGIEGKAGPFLFCRWFTCGGCQDTENQSTFTRTS